MTNFNENPSSWFDQFDEWAQAHPQNNPQWCARHWAPCPCLGANGILATVKMLSLLINGNPGKSPAQMQQVLDESATPQCCQMGDEQMYALWGACPPSGMLGSDSSSPA